MKWFRVVLISSLVLVVAGIGGLAYGVVHHYSANGSYSSPPPDYGTEPSFTMTNQNGQQVSTGGELAGKYQIVSFLFPYCRTYCPVEARVMTQLVADIKQAHLQNKAAVVSFNVDPAGAGQPAMRQFLQQYGDDPADPTWEYLTTDANTMREVVTTGMHVYYSKESLASEAASIAAEKAAGTYQQAPSQSNPLADAKNVGYDIVHNDDIEIVAPDGKIIAFYDDPTSLTEADLFQTVQKLIRQGG